MSYTLSAEMSMNFINLFTHIDCIIRAFGLAHITVDAFIGYQQCHN
jgi:hypothetical protein